jgi:hypothetical protein
MAITFTSILVGEGTLYIGASAGTAVDVGSTQEGVAVSWEPDMVDIEIDQFGDAARVVQSRVKVMIKTTLAEATLTNLATGWGYATGVTATQPGLQTGGLIFNFGLHGVYPEEKYMKIVGNAPGSTATVTKTRTYENWRCIQYGSSEHSLQRSDNVKIPVEFRVLPLTTQTGKEYGTITDVA